MLSVFSQVIRRDLLLAARQKADVLNTLFFFVVVVTIVPLGIGPEPNLLRAIAPGVVWVAALLAAILSLPRLFANDHADGTLEQMLLSAEPLPLIVLGKAAAHWLVDRAAADADVDRSSASPSTSEPARRSSWWPRCCWARRC